MVTQNVDGLHQMAGSQRVLELHGNIRVNRCQRCGAESSMEEVTFAGAVPRCACGGMLRPGVVWFGEALPQDVFDEAVEATQSCDLFLSVGTSAVVYPAASLPELAHRCGIPLIEVNPEQTPLSACADYCLQGAAGAVLPELVSAVENARNKTERSPREL